MRRIIIGIAAPLLAVLSVHVGWAGEITRASLHKLLVRSGTYQEAVRLPDLVRAVEARVPARGPEQAKGAHQKPPQPDEPCRPCENFLKPANTLRAISEQVRRNISEADARTLLVWFDSPLGKRISQAEADALTPRAYQQINASATKLLADKPRVQLAREQDRVQHTTDTLMQTRKTIVMASFVKVLQSMSPGEPLPAKELNAFKAQLAARFQQARPQLERATILGLVYTYRHIGTASLRKYLAFLQTPPAQRFHEDVIAGMEAVSRQAMVSVATGR